MTKILLPSCSRQDLRDGVKSLRGANRGKRRLWTPFRAPQGVYSPPSCVNLLRNPANTVRDSSLIPVLGGFRHGKSRNQGRNPPNTVTTSQKDTLLAGCGPLGRSAEPVEARRPSQGLLPHCLEGFFDGGLGRLVRLLVPGQISALERVLGRLELGFRLCQCR